MGTPQFAVPSLDALVMAGCDIVAVVTAPDKPAGRGQKINVKVFERLVGLSSARRRVARFWSIHFEDAL